MSDKKPKTDRKHNPPDGRGPRPTDPNELAAWIMKQSTEDNKQPHCDRGGGPSEACPR